MAKTKKKQRSKRGMAATKKGRASWRGMIQFGLVSIPVEAVNAHSIDADHIALHQLHVKCHSRIHYEKTCPVHGPVSNDEIVSGYEYSKGKYVEVDADEIDKLRSRKERNLDIQTFITPEEMDVIQFDGRMYYLIPATAAAHEAYSVFLEALAKKEVWGVGTIVMSGKEQPVVVRPYGTVFHMALLNYVDEMRTPAAVMGKPASLKPSAKNLRLAEQLIDNWFDDDFDFSTYTDHYFDKMKKLIEAKLAGKEIVEPEADDEPEVINLMDALKKSVASKAGERRAVRSVARKTSAKSTKKRRNAS